MIDTLKKHPFFNAKKIQSCMRLEHQGYCNENYLLVVDEIKYIVRKLLREDINRAFEWEVQSIAWKLGITAKPLVYDEANRFMIFEFLDGIHKNILDNHALKLLAVTLEKLHHIKIDAKPIEPYINNRTYKVLKSFEIIEKYPKEYVLCHNDLNPKNILFTKEIKLIDFEYAGINDKYFDLASVCVEFQLNDVMQKIFIDAYFQGKDFLLDKLEAYKVIYSVMCEEWFHNN